MSAVKPIDINVGEQSVNEDLHDAVRALNYSTNPVLRAVRAKLNDLLYQMETGGVLTIGGTTITVDTGAPDASATGHLYIRTDGGSGTTLYVREGASWVGK